MMSAEQIAATLPHKVLVVGLGKTGLSVVRYLRAHGVEAAVTDTRDHPPGLDALRDECPDLALFLGGFTEAAFAAADLLVVSPGVSLAEPMVRAALARGGEAVGDIELFARAATAPVVAITGSNGKSSVTTLIGEMARAAGVRAGVGGNLGTPALDLLADDVALYVLELSSFQLETTRSLRPRAAVVLNLSPDHLDRYRDLDHYAATKASIYAGCEVAVFNRDDPLVAAMVAGHPRAIGFGLDAPPQPDHYGLIDADGESWLMRGDERLLAASALQLRGRHNLINALAALALGEAAGLSRAPMLDALCAFRGLPHRTQFVARRQGLDWIDDSKGTNAGATIAALLGFHRPGDRATTVLIAGGLGKGADFGELGDVIATTCCGAVLIGTDASRIDQAIAGRVPVARAGSMEQAVARAATLAPGAERVLLSPACASFDMFNGYDHRGDLFALAVRGLAE